jgi:outer membrane cobalamin receptor
LRRYLILLIPLFSGFVLHGQTLNDTLKIREVQVFGKRSPLETGLKITRTDSLAIASSLTTDLSELLVLNTPLFIKSYGRGSAATASFRGTSSTHTRVIWNGIALNSPMRGSADLSLLPVMFIDEAWLLHGGSSLSESSGALGGSIQLSNKPDWGTNGYATALIERGSFNSGTYLVRIQAGKDRFRSITRFMLGHSDNDFPFFNVGVLPFRHDTLKNAGYRKLGALQEFYFRSHSENISVLRFWAQTNQRDLPQLMSYEGGRREEYQHDEQIRVQFEKKDYQSRLNYHFFTGFNYTALRYRRYITDPWFLNDDARSMESSLFSQLKVRSRLTRQLHFSGSVEMNYHWIDVLNLARNSGYMEDRLEGSGMIHAELRPGEHWGAFMLVRTDWYDNQWIPLVPSVGAEVQLINPIPALLKLNLSRNFNKPSLNDLYWIPGGNPELQPEDGFTADFGISTESRQTGIWKNEVSFFYSLIDNWILWQPAANGAWYWEAANVRKVISRGVEYNFSSQLQLKRIRVKWSGNYAFTRSTNENALSSIDKSRGKQLIYTPKHLGNLNAAAMYRSWTLKGSLGYTGRRYTQSSNEWNYYESVLNPFWLASLTVERTWDISQQLLLYTQIKADNLLDAGYQQILWRPMPGRHYSISLALKWRK